MATIYAAHRLSIASASWESSYAPRIWGLCLMSITRAMATSFSSTPASLAAKASCRSGLARYVALDARRIGSRSKTRKRQRRSGKPKKIGAAEGSCPEKGRPSMRMMLKFTLPVETSNAAINDGSLGRTMESILSKLKPEAAYFTPLEGKRGGMIFFDLADPSQIVETVEPFFLGLNATTELVPVMNADDLRKGLAKVGRT